MNEVGGNARSPRHIIRYLVACVAMVGAGVVLLAARDESPTGEAAHFEHTFSSDYVGTVWFTLSADSSKPRQVTVRWGRLRRTFEHRDSEPVTYTVEKGVGKERSDPLFVDVNPPADVVFSFGEKPPGSVNLSSEPWEALPYSPGVPSARPANADSATAAASVDESVSYGGVDAAGIGVRKAPELAAERLAVVKHGEVHTVRCWVRGQAITNSNLADRADDNAAYSSDIWWRIETPTVDGFIADVWFARRGTSDKLNLRECASDVP